MMTSTGDTFVPIVSSSPPPIDFGSSEEEDDEFGHFSAAKVEEFESPPGITSKRNKNHFFPIDVPHDKHNVAAPVSVGHSKAADSTISDPPLPLVNNKESNGNRTTEISNPPESLSNGLSHPESSHGSSDSLEFFQSGERALEDDTGSPDPKDSRSDASGDRESRDDIPPIQSISDMKIDSGELNEGSWGDFGTINKGTEGSPEIGSIDSESIGHDGTSSELTSPGEEEKLNIDDTKKEGVPVDQTFPDVSKDKSREFVESDLSPGYRKPSPPPLDNFTDKDDEFGDFGAFEHRGLAESSSEISDEKNQFSWKSDANYDTQTPSTDYSIGFGKFPSNSNEEIDFRKESGPKLEESIVSSNTDAQKTDDSTGKGNVRLKAETLDDDGDDDFAEFSSFRTDSVGTDDASKQKSQMPIKGGEEFAAFGDFKSEGSSANKDDANWASFGATSDETKADDDFGNFGSFKTPSSLRDDEADDDEFASFESSRNTSQKTGGTILVTQVFNGCFPDDTVPVIAGLSSFSMHQPLSGLINPPELGVGIKGPGLEALKDGSNGLGVWSVLSDMENTKAMGYQWTKSDSKKKLLSSIGLDERNILASRLGGVPKFASDLGMLQPSKPGESPLQPEIPQMQEEATFPPQESVPKVEFDWSGSGLTNPLDANNLNLDFFATETKSPSPSSKTKSKTVSTIDPDILNLETPADPIPSLAQTKPTSGPLDEIMKNSSMSMVQQPTKREAGLSDEANRVLDGLPNLSYMLAKVLMFPIKSPSVSMTGTSDSGLGGSLLD